MQEHSDKDKVSVDSQRVVASELGTDEETQSGSNFWFQVLISGGVSLVVAAVTAGAIVFVGMGKSKVATLDISGIVELEQMRMTALMMKKETSEDERMRAMSRAKSFGSTLAKSIADIQDSCKCVIVTRNAIIGTADLDVTEQVKSKLGLEGIDLDEARKTAEQAINRRMPSVDELSLKAQELMKK